LNNCSLGIDVGSVSTNLVLMGEDNNVVEKVYLRTCGRPIEAIIKGMSILKEKHRDIKVTAAGTTGSGRQLAAAMVGADIIKNEITAHSVAANHVVPDVRTIIEIGGQDSKIIFMRSGIVNDFAMNTVCAAGTGSFLDRQAARLDIPIEEFGGYAVRSENPVRIAGRCAVFAESDMISKQQAGHSNEDIIAGLCEALVRNFLNNLAKNREIDEPIIFQGGVAANVGIAAAFEKILQKKIVIPRYYDVMGAFGAALMAQEEIKTAGKSTCFIGFGCINNTYTADSFECNGCVNMCEVVQIKSNGRIIANWGDRCGKWGIVKDNAI
jgi:predicted CoA-substrate-specific enzyme activase